MSKEHRPIVQKYSWLPSAEKMLRCDYPDTLTVTIAEALGISTRAVYSKAAKMGLRKSPEYLDSASVRRMRSANIGASSRFKPGHAPWNKGIRGINYPRTMDTQFKNGHRGGRALARYKPIGSERLTNNGYLERKINDAMPMQKRWRAVHIIIWETAYGRTLPAGHALVFRDRNKSNIVLDNLELVTRAELMRRNSFHNYGPEIAQLVQLRGAINRQINLKESSACQTI